MATHHISLRRACPALFGLLTAPPGELGSEKYNPTQARRTSSNMRYCFYPRERRTVEPTETVLWIGKVQGVLCVYSRTRARKRQSAGAIHPRLKSGAFWPLSVN